MQTFMFVLMMLLLCSCATQEDYTISEREADARAVPVLRIEQKINDMVRASRDWEMAKFRSYKQADLDADGVDDTVLLTTFEHGNNWRRELFVCLSSSPGAVMHLNLGGKGEREAESFDIENRTIIVKGKKYAEGDAMCCPSVPYQSTYIVSNGRILEKK